MATDGTPISAWGTTLGTRVHFGTNPHQSDVTVQTPCCGYSPDVAVDTGGQAYVGWYSNADNEAGPYVQAVSPGGLVGGKLHVLGSATADRKHALSIDQRAAIVARAGGGVYVGYGSGYPTFTTVNIWRVGSAAPSIRIAARGAQDVNLAAGPDGRLWLMWHTSDRLNLARTNRAAHASARCA